MSKKLAKIGGRELLELFEEVVRANHYDPNGELINSLPDFTYQQLENEILLRLGEEIEEDEDYDEEVEELDLDKGFADSFSDEDYDTDDDYY